MIFSIKFNSIPKYLSFIKLLKVTIEHNIIH